MENLIWIVLLAPLLGAIINGLFLTGRPVEVQRKVSPWLAVAAAVVAFGAAVGVALSLKDILGAEKFKDVIGYSWIEVGALSVPFGLRLDALSMVMTLVVTGVGSLIHVFSVGYMSEDPRIGRFFTYLNLFLFSMLTLVLGNSFLLMFVGWEGVGLCSYLLIGFFFEKVSAAQAGKKAFIINRVGDFGFLLAMFAIFWLTGSLVFNTPDHNGALDLAKNLHTTRIGEFNAVTVICLLLLLAATGKSAQMPLYLWLPDAMEGPTPVSALIHAATMVTAGVYMIARTSAYFALSAYAQTAVVIVGVVTALYAALIAIKQYDIKRVLAYSTVSQLGFMFVGVGVGANSAGIGHLVTHAFFKALMFLGAGAVMHALEGQLDLRKMGNLRKHLPVTFWTFAIGWFAICGFPPAAGFFSKDKIIESAFHHGFEWAGWVLILVALMTAFYMTRMFVTVFFGTERIEMGDEGHGHGDDHVHDHGHDHGHGHGHVHVHPEQPVMNAPLVVLAILSVLGGLVVMMLPGLLQGVAPDLAAGHGGGHGDGHGEAPQLPFLTVPTMAELLSVPALGSLIAAAVGAGVAWAAMGPDRLAKGWTSQQERLLGLPQTIYDGGLHLIVVRAGSAICEILFRVVDRILIDGLVNGTGKLVNVFAESLRESQTGYVRQYALVMKAGTVFVLACFLVVLNWAELEKKVPVLKKVPFFSQSQVRPQ